MYKLKYYYLTKEEKKNLKKEFYSTDFGIQINRRLTRLLITGITGIIFSIYLFIVASTKWNYVYASILAIASFIFIIGSFKVRIDKLNAFLVKKNSNKKK